MYASNSELRPAVKRAPSWLFAPDRTPGPVVRGGKRNTSIGGLSFAVEVEGEHVAMRISADALRMCFGASRCSSTWLAAYRLNALVIDARAIELHRRNPREPVCLGPSDFPDLPAKP